MGYLWGTSGCEMGEDRRYLERHGDQYRVVVKVPPELRQWVGKAHLKRGLKTDSLAEANRRKWPVIKELKEDILRVRRTRGYAETTSKDPLIAEALRRKQEIEEEEFDPNFDPEENYSAADSMADRAYEIEARDGLARAKEFADVALGRRTPIEELVGSWLMEVKVRPRTEADYRRAIEKFVAWCRSIRVEPTVEACTRKVVGRFIRKAFIEVDTDPKTTNKYVSALSSYWRWLIKRGHAAENPWSNQSVPKGKTRTTSPGRDKREFSDVELRCLFDRRHKKPDVELPRWQKRSGAWDALPDVMRIAAFSGMRIEEIANLSVANCRGGVFDVTSAKTKAGIRRVPIHPELKAIVVRRSDGKDDDAPLIHELKEPPIGSKLERSMPLVKAFVTYRRMLGVDDRKDRERQSRIDFHSFRRWFITKAEGAGIAPHIISAVVGHERQGMTLGVYSGGPTIEQMKECVEAVRLSKSEPRNAH